MLKTWGGFPRDPNMDKVAELLKKHKVDEATQFLTEKGYKNAEEDVRVFHEFLKEIGTIK